VFLLAALATVLLWASACQPTGDDSGAAPARGSDSEVLVYSGRNESLVMPLFDRFSEGTGIQVRVRYGDTAELAATLMEEGANSRVDVFLAQDAAALGALAQEDLLQPLAVFERPTLMTRALMVPAAYRDAQNRWVGLSGRARTVVYNPERIDEAELPRSLDALIEPRFSGRFGIAPTNASFQAHVAYYLSLNGAEKTSAWLAGLARNEPLRYAKNGAIVEAVLRGEVDFGLVNHYYLLRALAEDPEAPGRNYYMPEGAASNFVNAAGVGAVSASPNAAALIEFLLSDEAQRYFAEQTFEIPLVAGNEPLAVVGPVSLESAGADWQLLANQLEPALDAIAASGLLQ
jgi:iron(III) transport system substrate-binding protein